MARERILTRDVLLENTGDLLIETGYEGFTISLLAERLKVSRGAIYKYYSNKDTLLMEYMLYHMEQFIEELKGIEANTEFLDQFDFLIQMLYRHSKVHQILKTARQIPIQEQTKTEEDMNRFHKMYEAMTKQLKQFISFGKQEKYIRPELPDEIIFVFLFQLVEVPSTSQIKRDQWMKHVTESMKRGIFEKY